MCSLLISFGLVFPFSLLFSFIYLCSDFSIHRITCIKDHYIYVNEFGGRHRIIIIRMLNAAEWYIWWTYVTVNIKQRKRSAYTIQHSNLCTKWWFYVKYISKENNNICFFWFNLDFSSRTDLLFGPQKLSCLSDI